MARNERRRFERLYSSFTFVPVDRAADAAWRLGGAAPSLMAGLFDYCVGGSVPHTTPVRWATEADTNMATPSSMVWGKLSIESWVLRLSKAVDDPLRAFLGACSVRLTVQSMQSIIAKDTLVDLIERQPLVGQDPTGAHVLCQHEAFRVDVGCSDAEAVIAYSRHLEKQDMPTLKVWLYLEGTAVHEVR